LPRIGIELAPGHHFFSYITEIYAFIVLTALVT
jgi:hypothetical protein